MRLIAILMQVTVPDPSAPPELAGTLGQILAWARYGTLWAGGLTVLVSALVWGFSANTANYQNVSRAKSGILTGLIVFFIGPLYQHDPLHRSPRSDLGLMGFIGDWISDFFADLAKAAITWILETTVAMIVVVIRWILDSPDGTLGAPALQGMLAQGIAVGRYVLPLMLLLGLIQAGIQGRPGAVVRLAFIEMPLVAAAMVAIAPVTGVLLAATDALTEWVIDEAAVTAMQSAFETLPSAAFLAAAPHFLPVVGVLSLIALIGAMLVWGMMLMRNLGVVFSVLIGPGHARHSPLASSQVMGPRRGPVC